jgi:hypothetical protein
VRDGVVDRVVDDATRAEVTGKECGNGVRLQHADGYETQYCHLLQGSIQVKVNDTVKTGEKLGYIGLSGMTEFPHLHLSLFKEGRKIDPFNAEDFRGMPTQLKCGDTSASLWEVTPPYPSVQIAHLGVAASKPSRQLVDEGYFNTREVAPTAPALIGWFVVYTASASDIIGVRITDPQGQELVQQTFPMPRNQIRYFGFAGAPRPANGRWPEGEYTLTVFAGEQGTLKDSQKMTFTVRSTARN